MLRSFVLVSAAVLLFFAVHAIVFHRRRIHSRFRALCVIFALVGAAYCAAYWLLPMPLTEPRGLFFFLNGLAYYGFIFLGYLEIYFTADRSITIRIMREILKSSGKEITIEEFKKVFETEEKIFLRRFSEMAESGYLSAAGSGYRLSRKGLFTAAFYGAMIDYLNLEGG